MLTVLWNLVPALIFLFFSFICRVHAQETSERLVSFKAENEALSLVIERLSREYGFGFTYNAADESFAAVVSYSAVNLPLKKALTELLHLTGHDFYLIGNQVVIVPGVRLQPGNEPRVAPPEANHIIIPIADHTVPNPLRLTDTVILIDTVLVVKTIERTDTLILRDTVWLKPEEPPRRPGRIPSIREDIFRHEPDRDNGFWIGFGLSSFHYSMKYKTQPEALELKHMVEKAEGSFFPNLSSTIKAGFTRQGWSIQTGIGISKFSQPFKHSYTISYGNYYRQDTLDIYYTIILADTNWIYVLDSTWIPLEKQDFNTNVLNRYTYVDFPVLIGYQHQVASDMRVFVNTGVNFAFPIAISGKTISPETIGTPVNIDNFKLASPLVSFSFGAGIRYRMNALFDIAAGINTRMMLNSSLSDHPVRRIMNTTSLNAGIIYNLP